MKAAQLLLAASKPRRTHPRHWADTFQNLKAREAQTKFHKQPDPAHRKTKDTL
jgi:hypothetical protein